MNEYITKNELHKKVCKNIKKFRIQAGLTQEKLSEKIDISHDYLRQLESEKGQKDFTFYLFIYDIKFTLEPSKKTLRDVDIQLSYIFSHGGGKGG